MVNAFLLLAVQAKQIWSNYSKVTIGYPPVYFLKLLLTIFFQQLQQAENRVFEGFHQEAHRQTTRGIGMYGRRHFHERQTN